MGMQSASIQQSPNPSSGKGMGGQYNQTPYNGGQFDPTEGGGLSTIPNTQQYAQPTGGPPLNQQSMGNINGQSDASFTTADAMPVRNQAMGKGGSGNVTMPRQGGQPRMGMPNAYSNTIQPWDNASIQTRTQSGKGKGY
jgi:hypothetical protein